MLTGAQGRPVTWPAADWGGGGKRKTWRRRDSVRRPMLRVLLCVGLTQFHPTALLPHYLKVHVVEVVVMVVSVYIIYNINVTKRGDTVVNWAPLWGFYSSSSMSIKVLFTYSDFHPQSKDRHECVVYFCGSATRVVTAGIDFSSHTILKDRSADMAIGNKRTED